MQQPENPAGANGAADDAAGRAPDGARALVLGLLGLALYAGWLAVDGHASAWWRMAVSDLVFIVAPLLAGWACAVADRARGGRHRGWWWIAVGCFTWAGAGIIWAFYELVLGDVAPFPSFADLGFVGYAVPVVVGITKFPRSMGTIWSRWRITIDGVVIAGCLLLASLLWVLTPVVDGTSGSFVRFDALAYPLADVAVASILLTRCMLLPHARRQVWLPLSTGLLVLALTDSVYVRQTYAGHYAPGGLLDAGWAFSFLLIALAARMPEPSATAPAQSDCEPPTLLQRLLPYTAMALAVVAVGSEFEQVRRHHGFFWLTGPLVAAICIRQIVVLGDHTTLARSLAEAVERRTVELAHRELWWRELVQNLSDVVVVIDPDGQVAYCSPSLQPALGVVPEHLADAAELASYVHADDLEATLAVMEPVLDGRAKHGFAECRLRRTDGRWSWFELTAMGQLSSDALAGTVITLHDVSERRRLTDRLAHQAYHDSLTGLPNRAFLTQRIEQALQRRAEQPFALMLIDLDDFKVINDRYGHSAGDLVLEVVGRRLEATVRVEDSVARLGGDEFAVLVAGNADDVRATAERIAERLAQPVVTNGQRFLVRASVGAVFAADDDSETAHSLLSHADIALYEAKARDKGSVVLLNAAERDQAAKQVYMREQIAQPALEEFAVVYQPIVELSTGRLRGVESLLRWAHPDLGYVSPEVFIPMAEHGGSIQLLGWHVLEEAIRQLSEWSRQWPDQRLGVGVNVSVRQLDETGFATRLLAMIEHHGIEPDQLVLEITEQSLAVDFETAVAVVAELRAGGVSVAVDDYGTGYSSLRYLHRFAADVVKIDRSFIANLSGSVHTQKIVRSVIEMSHSLDVQSIAEGIETPIQLEIVRALGCELGQGYLFARPLQAAEVSDLLRHNRSLFPEGVDGIVGGNGLPSVPHPRSAGSVIPA